VKSSDPFVVAWLYAPTAAGASSVLMVRFTLDRSGPFRLKVHIHAGTAVTATEGDQTDIW
jgi:hypothetical protein